MAKFFTTLTNERGDVLPNYRLQVVDSGGSVVTITSDEGGTRFTDASGNTVNYATATSNGRASFYWTPDNGQVLQILDAGGNLVDSEADFSDAYLLDEMGGTIAQSSVTDLVADLAAKASATDLTASKNKQPQSPRYDNAAAADGTTDASTEFAAAVAAKDVIQVDGDHRLVDTQSLTFEQSMRGFGRDGKITVTGTESLTNDILFRLNTDAAGTATTQQTPNLPATRIENLRVDGELARAGALELNAFTFGGTLLVDNTQVIGFSSAFKQATDSNSYSDKVTFRQVHFSRNAPQSSGQYLISLEYFGDALRLESIDFRSVQVTGSTEALVNGVSAKWRQSSLADGLINGSHKWDRCVASTIARSHHESGGSQSYDSVQTLVDNVYFRRANDATYTNFDITPVQFKTGGTYRAGRYTLASNVFTYWHNFATTGYPVDKYDVQVDSGRTDIRVQDQVRWFASKSGNVDNATYTGIRAWDGAAGLAAFNRYSHFASEQSRLRNQKLDMRVSTPALTVTQGLLAGGTSAFDVWDGATGTVHVAVQILVDPVRKVGFNGTSVRSYAVTNGGNCILLDLDGPDHPYIARIYFGAGAASYDKVVEVPMMGGSRALYYNGTEVAGITPTARAAGAVDAINGTLIGAFRLEPGDNGAGAYGRAVMRSTAAALAAPAAGTFSSGDRIENKTGALEYDGTNWVRVGGASVTQQTGTSYTFAMTDGNSVVELSNAAAITATIPPNSSVAFDIGTFIELHQTGAGTVTVAAGAGVTLLSRGSLVALAGQEAVAGIRKVATNTWRLTGDIA